MSASFPDALAALIGLEVLESGPERARARLPVTDSIRQIHGLVHGGIHTVVAESICSQATADAVAADGGAAFGQASQTTLLRPISEGHVHASASVRRRGRTTWIWDCELSDDEGRLCALVRMTVAVRASSEAPQRTDS